MDKPAWQRLLRKARAGDPEAQFEVACMYDLEGYQNEDGTFVVREQPARALPALAGAENGLSRGGGMVQPRST